MSLKTEKTFNVINIIKKISTIILWVLFALVFLLLAWLAVDKFILKSAVPSVFGYSTLTIATGSMNGKSVMVEGQDPVEVDIGDLIVIKDFDTYKIGDVITFLNKGDTVPTTHRIIGITEDGFITKGDANNVKDTVPVKRECVIGKVVAHYSKLGKAGEWVKQEGWIYIVAALAILAIGSWIARTADEEEPAVEQGKKPQEESSSDKKEPISQPLGSSLPDKTDGSETADK